MNHKTVPLTEGLYLVATPIGTARDITLRAMDVLASAEVLAAEDTRTLRKLMDIHSIPLGDRPLVAYHDHSTDRDRDRLAQYFEAGKSVAYASEAGTPLIADPGFKLAALAREFDKPVTAIPGPSAVTTAMAVAGQPSDRFMFAGFLPNQSGARLAQMQSLLACNTTLIFYESPKRVAAFCADLETITGPDHSISLCRELTKRFEDIQITTVGALRQASSEKTLKGEVVLVVAPFESNVIETLDIDTALRKALLTLRVKDAAESVAGALGLPKRQVYQRALEMRNEPKAEDSGET